MKLAQIYLLIAATVIAPRISFGAADPVLPAPEAVFNGSGIKKTTVYDEAYLYIHLSEVKEGTAAKIKEAYNANSKAKGVVLDLRFAGGTDLGAAAAVANLFVNKRETMLQVGSKKFTSSGANDSLALPSAVLINSKTSGAAEVLAAILNGTNSGLTFGTATAATNSYPEEVLVKGRPLESVQPDIVASSPPEQEMIYMEDPYKNISAASSTNSTEISSLPPVRRRMTEADLIRSQRSFDELEAAESSRPEVRVIRDPVLARGLDFLKAVNLLQVKRG